MLWLAKMAAYLAFAAVMLMPVYIFIGQAKLAKEFTTEIKKTIEVSRKQAEERQKARRESEPEDYYHESSDDSSE